MSLKKCKKEHLSNVLVFCETSTSPEGFTRLFDNNDFSVEVKHEYV